MVMQSILQSAGLRSKLDINPTAQALIDYLEQQNAQRSTDYQNFSNYYHGLQNAKLPDRLKKFIHPQMQFRDNFAKVVVDALTDRLDVKGFESTNDNLSKWAWDNVWLPNRLDAGQKAIHNQAIVKGDAFALVEWDEEENRPMVTSQPAEMIRIFYSESTRRPEMASKKWIWTPEIGHQTRARMNLYYPDRVEKYVQAGHSWVKFIVEGEEWPLPLLMPDGTPVGIPLIHFKNGVTDLDYGFSELIDVLPLQDILNKLLLDLVQIDDTLAFGQRWTLDINHGRSKIDIVPGSVQEFHGSGNVNEHPTVGEWQPGNVDNILKSMETIVQHIAGVTRTPQYLFQLAGGSPSGEALKTSEAGLVHKAEDRQVIFGNAWEDVIKMAARMALANKKDVGIKAGEAFGVSTLWESAETRDDTLFLAGLESKARMGVPQYQLWREMGYTQSEIEAMKKDLEDAKVSESNVGARMLKEFEKGQGNGVTE